MTDFDRALDAALSAEESDLLRRIGDEPGAFGQMFALFRGRTGWVNVLMMIAQAAFFFVGVWAAWRFFQSDDAVQALHWGLPAAVSLLTSLIIKLSMYPVLHVNQLRLEIRRMEALALARKA